MDTGLLTGWLNVSKVKCKQYIFCSPYPNHLLRIVQIHHPFIRDTSVVNELHISTFEYTWQVCPNTVLEYVFCIVYQWIVQCSKFSSFPIRFLQYYVKLDPKWDQITNMVPDWIWNKVPKSFWHWQNPFVLYKRGFTCYPLWRHNSLVSTWPEFFLFSYSLLEAHTSTRYVMSYPQVRAPNTVPGCAIQKLKYNLVAVLTLAKSLCK